ncbi:MAG: hypothetical protein M3P40_09415 [Actinomycetota bacterium]|nr:hypothetical protein [Actinomycetota bacterium]
MDLEREPRRHLRAEVDPQWLVYLPLTTIRRERHVPVSVSGIPSELLLLSSIEHVVDHEGYSYANQA